MRIQAVVMSVVAIAGLGLGGSSAWTAPAGDLPAVTRIQYNPYPDRYTDPRYYPDDRRDGYYAPYPPPRDGYDPAYDREAPLWRPGDVLPLQLLDIVVDDWDRRGLGRPPGGHFWVRIDPQFILVRESDRMIARVISFD